MDKFPNEYEEDKDLLQKLYKLEYKLAEKDFLIAVLEEKNKEYCKKMEWISVEDEPKPNEGEKIIVHSETGAVSIRFYFAEAGFPRFPIVTHWMKYEPPKPKEPTFKDVFLKAFPKAIYLDVNCCAIFPEQFVHDSCDNNCEACWNRTYFEEAGEEK